jgi:predicted nucleotide-binding protein (sugar kinase/HSP70/actin superfamily)
VDRPDPSPIDKPFLCPPENGFRWKIMDESQHSCFDSLSKNVGRFDMTNKTVLIPEMNRIGGHLLAATFRGYGVQAKVMETFKGQDLGMAYTSGKECYPCQVTMGDILHYLGEEKSRKGEAFHPEDYVYFMPESDGPCRFGMYNKFQRIILDSFPNLRKVKIGALTAEDAYSLAGVVDEARVSDLRKTAYLSVVVADILDRLLWRIRPYEKEAGITDSFIEDSMEVMAQAFETYGPETDYDPILLEMEALIEAGKALMDPLIPPKPLIGIVGEIYLRTHVHANQDLIRLLERHGAEVVNASIAEWVNYISYDGYREAKTDLKLSLKQIRFSELKKALSRMLHFGGDLLFKQYWQDKVYSRVRSRIDLWTDHRVAELEEILVKTDLFTFDISTETCLSIAGIVKCASEGYNGVVNVYPFTCMPSTATSAIVKPLMNKQGLPYLDTPYDSSIQPGREGAVRTFMYQAHQHWRRNGRRA